MSLIAVVEGDTDLPVVRKLAEDAGLDITSEIDCAGKDYLDEHLDAYNAAAQGSPWFVLRDLDTDAPCAGDYIRNRALAPETWMCFRLAVREMEAWLLADSESIARFLKVPRNAVPANPDADADPTRTIVNLARRSTSAKVQKALVPKPGISAQVGPLYEAKIIEFARDYWSLDRACQNSASLARARTRLRELAEKWDRYVNLGPVPAA